MSFLKRTLASIRRFRNNQAHSQLLRDTNAPAGVPPRTDSNAAGEATDALQASESPPKCGVPRSARNRDGRYIQIGLDFGTSYCKVVCRDIVKDKAWVHVSKSPANKELPFLLPSALRSDGTCLSRAPQGAHYHEGGLPHVKLALARVAAGDFADPHVRPFHRDSSGFSTDETKRFVIACAVYLLGGILAEVRRDIRARITDFGEHPGDYEAVSLAVPVADAENPEISAVFRNVLELAFHCSESFEDFREFPLNKLSSLVEQERSVTHEHDEFKFFVYPEVSAGVQGFVRSRVSSDGIYVFSETGAGTVDHSVFRLFRPQDQDARLSYLNARVLPLGSSQIEIRAAEQKGDVSPCALEEWRKRKEAGEYAVSLRHARDSIGEEILRESYHTLGVARRKLISKAEFREIRAIFGGGGHVDDPYKDYLLAAFIDEKHRLHTELFRPDVIGLPTPVDLEPEQQIRNWMNRLWIAYGLSFFPKDYPQHRFPQEIADSVPVLERLMPEFVSKDMC